MHVKRKIASAVLALGVLGGSTLVAAPAAQAWPTSGTHSTTNASRAYCIGYMQNKIVQHVAQGDRYTVYSNCKLNSRGCYYGYMK